MALPSSRCSNHEPGKQAGGSISDPAIIEGHMRPVCPLTYPRSVKSYVACEDGKPEEGFFTLPRYLVNSPAIDDAKGLVTTLEVALRDCGGMVCIDRGCETGVLASIEMRARKGRIQGPGS